MRRAWFAFGFVTLVAVTGVAAGGGVRQAPVAAVPVVHRVLPHDTSSFTQGLVWQAGRLYESSGLYGQSGVREVDLRTGRVLRSRRIADAFFGEGLARVGKRLVQLTWKENTALVFDRDTFQARGRFRYRTEGWGLCFDGRRLVMSDGTNRLFFRDPGTFRLLGTISVRRPVGVALRLNELECVDGKVYANVWPTDTIAVIDPVAGAVEQLVDAGGLLTAAERARADVLNGIAYNSRTRRFYLTGKHWPKLFEVTFREATP
jgi:glutamine cyclotransferase